MNYCADTPDEATFYVLGETHWPAAYMTTVAIMAH